MVPHMLSVFMSYMTLMVSPKPYMKQLLHGPHTCTYSPPHVKCLHVLYHSYGPLIPYTK